MGNTAESTQNYGKIEIILHKPKYTSGDQVNGLINVLITKSFPSNHLYLLIEGKESTQLVRSENVTDHKSKISPLQKFLRITIL